FGIPGVEGDGAVEVLDRLGEVAESDAGDATLDVGCGQPGVLTDRLGELVSREEVQPVAVVREARIEGRRGAGTPPGQSEDAANRRNGQRLAHHGRGPPSDVRSISSAI